MNHIEQFVSVLDAYIDARIKAAMDNTSTRNFLAEKNEARVTEVRTQLIAALEETLALYR